MGAGQLVLTLLSSLGVEARVGVDDVADQAMTYDIDAAEVGEGNVLDSIKDRLDNP